MKHDRLIGLIYLVLVPVAILAIFALGAVEHRAARHRTERVTQRVCKEAVILRNVLIDVLPAKDPPNLTAAQKKQLAVMRDAVEELKPLTC